MKWIGISGTWRTTNRQVEQDVRAAVRAIISAGDGIVSGGATGVDYFAADEALKLYSDGSRLRVAIPSTFGNYIGHLQAWADGYDTGDPSVSRQEIGRLISQLNGLKTASPASIVEGPDIPALDIDQKAYDERSSVVAVLADELVAFSVNNSTGTQDTINKARAAGKKVSVYSYDTAHDGIYGNLKPGL
jgi:hypothetical protein